SIYKELQKDQQSLNQNQVNQIIAGINKIATHKFVGIGMVNGALTYHYQFGINTDATKKAISDRLQAIKASGTPIDTPEDKAALDFINKFIDKIQIVKSD